LYDILYNLVIISETEHLAIRHGVSGPSRIPIISERKTSSPF